MKKMMKKIAKTVLVSLCALSICLPVSAQAAQKKISRSKAKEIALDHADISGKDATFTKIKLDRDDGVTVYEVEFYVGNDEYDYEINAYTGKVVSYDYDSESYSSDYPDKDTLTKSQIKKIALTDAGLSESKVTFTKVKLDKDDGVYEVEFYIDNREYDYEIDAVNGEILEVDFDAESYKKPSSNGKSITAAKAGEIAFKHAGLKKSDVSRYKCKKDRDDGITKYEVEFTYDGVEYEYEINAANGKILSWDSDTDD